MSWTWDRLSEAVRRLKLPEGEYAVDRIGYGLSRDRTSTADRVELLVTETGWRRLKERAWREAGGGTVLRHPTERALSARIVLLDDVRHEIADVDGVPVVAVEPDVPTPQKESWRQRLTTGVAGFVFAAVLAVIAYGGAILYPTPAPASVVEHLMFETTKVEATVDGYAENGSCTGSRVWDSSPRRSMTLRWTEDGQTRTASYESCGGDIDSPQDIWVTAAGEVVSQQSPWIDHFWPVLIIGIVPFGFIVLPLFDRIRAHWWRRRRA